MKLFAVSIKIIRSETCHAEHTVCDWPGFLRKVLVLKVQVYDLIRTFFSMYIKCVMS